MVTGEHLDPKEEKKIAKLGGACEGWICGWIPVSGLRFPVYPGSGLKFLDSRTGLCLLRHR